QAAALFYRCFRRIPVQGFLWNLLPCPPFLLSLCLPLYVSGYVVYIVYALALESLGTAARRSAGNSARRGSRTAFKTALAFNLGNGFVDKRLRGAGSESHALLDLPLFLALLHFLP